jgi:hypothetical protein
VGGAHVHDLVPGLHELLGEAGAAAGQVEHALRLRGSQSSSCAAATSS